MWSGITYDVALYSFPRTIYQIFFAKLSTNHHKQCTLEFLFFVSLPLHWAQGHTGRHVHWDSSLRCQVSHHNGWSFLRWKYSNALVTWAHMPAMVIWWSLLLAVEIFSPSIYSMTIDNCLKYSWKTTYKSWDIWMFTLSGGLSHSGWKAVLIGWQGHCLHRHIFVQVIVAIKHLTKGSFT